MCSQFHCLKPFQDTVSKGDKIYPKAPTNLKFQLPNQSWLEKISTETIKSWHLGRQHHRMCLSEKSSPSYITVNSWTPSCLCTFSWPFTHKSNTSQASFLCTFSLAPSLSCRMPFLLPLEVWMPNPNKVTEYSNLAKIRIPNAKTVCKMSGWSLRLGVTPTALGWLWIAQRWYEPG